MCVFNQMNIQRLDFICRCVCVFNGYKWTYSISCRLCLIFVGNWANLPRQKEKSVIYVSATRLLLQSSSVFYLPAESICAFRTFVQPCGVSSPGREPNLGSLFKLLVFCKIIILLLPSDRRSATFPAKTDLGSFFLRLFAATVAGVSAVCNLPCCNVIIYKPAGERGGTDVHLNAETVFNNLLFHVCCSCEDVESCYQFPNNDPGISWLWHAFTYRTLRTIVNLNWQIIWEISNTYSIICQ